MPFLEAAREYYRVLQAARDADAAEVARLKQRLDELAAPFSDNVAYHAFLEMEREAAGLGAHHHRRRFIRAFPGTSEPCFDDQCQSVPRPGGSL